jgi:hypothetical protein
MKRLRYESLKRRIINFIIKWIKIFLTWTIGIVALWLVIGKYNSYIQDKFGLPASPGTFGDSFGALGVIISGFALIGVIITMIKQQSQIDDQTHFIARSEMNETFFKLLNHLKEVKQDLDWSQSNGEKLKEIYDDLKSRFGESPEHTSVCIFHGLYDDHRADFDTYFRTLRYMLKYLGEHPLDPAEKRIYSNLLRAQTSQEEAILIYYNMELRNAKTDPRDPKFGEYIEKFNLLADLKSWTQIYDDHKEKIKSFIELCESKQKSRWWKKR